MSEYIVNVPDEEAEYFIARFGFENVKLMGYGLTGEIVRCRDCRWISKDTKHYKACYRLPDCEFTVDPDGFCAWAKRKEGGDE